MEPGWDLLKKLAKSGNIGRVAQTETDFLNSMSTGETSVAFWNMSPWKKLSDELQDRGADARAEREGHEGVHVPGRLGGAQDRRSRRRPRRITSTSSSAPRTTSSSTRCWDRARPIERRSRAASPSTSRSTATISHKYAYFPDFTLLAAQLNDTVKRFETEVVPLL